MSQDIAEINSTKMSRCLQDVMFVCIITLTVFVACLFGIFSRPIGFLAALWPANAILLGLLIRNPHKVSICVWVFAAFAYVAADLITGSKLITALLLNAANLIGVAVGFYTLARLPEVDRRLQRPFSVLYIFAGCTVFSCLASTLGGFASRFLFQADLLQGIISWLTAELVSYFAIVPVFLTAPSPRTLLQWKPAQLSSVDFRPLAALVASMLASAMIGGPGAIAFPVPALLWCALSYSLFSTACLTLACCMQTQITMAASLILEGNSVESVRTSIRLGASLLALGPLTVASVNFMRNNLIAQLNHAVSHDALTGCLTRAAMDHHVPYIVEKAKKHNEHVFALMLDVDHFKMVNDTFGHAAGDHVLKTISNVIGSALRHNDILVRLGGEEFVVLMACGSQAQANTISERILDAVRQQTVIFDSVRANVTISIGLAMASANDFDLNTLLTRADQAVYRAKSQGRDCIYAA